MQKYLLKSLVKDSLKKTLIVNTSSGSSGGWKDKPASWPDIRTNAQLGHIYLLAGTYRQLGFTVEATGGYSVNIDGVHYNDYASGSSFTMSDWSSYTATQGYDIDYPTSYTKAHIIDIYPQNSSENITKFTCARPSGASYLRLGLLWEHFEINNRINLSKHLNDNSKYRAINCIACTSKNNILDAETLEYLFYQADALEYVPTITNSNTTATTADRAFQRCYALKEVKIKDINSTSFNYTFTEANNLEKIDINRSIPIWSYSFQNCYKLKKLPNIDMSSQYNGEVLNDLLTNANSLENTILDLTNFTGYITCLQCYGTNSTNYFMGGFKGLRLPQNAKMTFTGTSPQINVSYTGMDRQALVQLFNDLPTVSASQVIKIEGCTGTADLTNADIAIATDKGWTISL